MIGMSFKPPGATQAWWDDWCPRAERATMKAIEAFESWFESNNDKDFRFDLDDDIWKRLKEWYNEHLFRSKCAYCEAEFSRYYGDAEHYRPKASVKRRDGYATCAVPDPNNGGTPRLIAHPGYFWLAYDWRNIIPACVMCNSGRGKNDRFEIQKQYAVLLKLPPAESNPIPETARPIESPKWPGYFYPSPPMLDLIEDPLLLNPLNPLPEKDPCKHLIFGKKGTVSALSQYGRESIATLQLATPALQKQRHQATEAFQTELFVTIARVSEGKMTQVARNYLAPYQRGEKPFSAAKLAHYRRVFPTGPLAGALKDQ